MEPRQQFVISAPAPGRNLISAPPRLSAPQHCYWYVWQEAVIYLSDNNWEAAAYKSMVEAAIHIYFNDD